MTALASRDAERVLRIVAEAGSTTADEPITIELLYAKLGVRTRTGAVARVLLLRPPTP